MTGYSRQLVADYSAKRLASTSASGADFVEVKSNLAKELASYLLAENQLDDLNSLLRDIKESLASQYGIVEADAYSAHDLEPGTRKDISEMVKKLYPDAKKILINQIDDSEVIGGVRVILPYHSFDVTLKSQLNQLRQLTAA